VKPFSRVTGRAAVIDRADVDTDQIMPKQFLKRIERTGFGQFLFHDWRFDPEGRPRPEFELWNPAYEGAKILIAGRNFGSGSSREHAPWGLQDYGFEAIVAPSFGDIFAANSLKIGLVPITLPPDEVKALMDSVDPVHGSELTVDLERLRITDGNGRELVFAFDEAQRHRLLEGLDDIAIALRREDEIAAWERSGRQAIDTTVLR